MIELAKKLAAVKAVDTHLIHQKIIGIGSGSTIVYAVKHIAEKYHNGYPITACIPSSFQASLLITELGLPLGSLNQYPKIEITFDGADEVDHSKNCIKGGGGCHLQEKLLIANSESVYIIADDRKNSEILGTQWNKGIPIEVVPMAYKSILNKLTDMGGNPKLRMATSKAGPCVTDNGNFIIDADFGQIHEPATLEMNLLKIPGILETGLFVGLVDGVYFGCQDGTVITRI